MSVILLVAGSFLAVAGVALVGFGVGAVLTDVGSTLIISGTIAFTGGLILAAIGVAVGELTRIANALRMRPVARPVRPLEAAEPVPAARPPLPRAPAPPKPRAAPPVNELPDAEPRAPAVVRPPEPRPIETRTEPRPVEARSFEPPAPIVRAPLPRVPRPQADSTVDVSANAIERLRSNLPRPERKPDAIADFDDATLSPNVGTSHSQGPGEAAPTLKPPVEALATEAPAENGAPRLDFLFRSKPSRSRRSQPTFDALWPKRAGDAEAGVEDQQAEPGAEPPTAEQPPADKPVSQAPTAASLMDGAPRAADAAQTSAPPQPGTILKSGVVDGMPYTLYADGAIEAQLPEGTVRFGSIRELRAHIEINS